jgi:DNA-binding NarL/FixJ family response regulator
MSNSTVDPYHLENGKDAIILIDDETLSQDCLAEAMRSAFPQTIILGAPSINELPRPNGSSVALVLMKIKLQPIVRDGLASDIRTIARYLPRVPIVVITASDDAVSVGTAIAAGAQGVIPVTASLKIAVAALQLVMAGGTYYPRNVMDSTQVREDMFGTPSRVDPLLPASAQPRSPSMPASVANEGAEPPRVEDANGLATTFTAREADVLAALQKGRSNKWIAHHLNLSENTVKVHIRHIMRKLHATNRTEAVILSQHLASDFSGH